MPETAPTTAATIPAATDGDAIPAKPNQTRAPRQQRSQETLDRIVEATRQLLDGRDFESLGVQEICEQAGVSRSSFYARFPDKQALITELFDRHRKSRIEQLARQTAGLDWEAMSMESVVSMCIVLYLEDRRSLDPYLRSLVQVAAADPQISRQRAELDSFTMTLIRDHLMKRVGSTDPALGKRVEFGIRSMAAIVQEAVQPPHLFVEAMELTDETLVAELTRMFCVYTGLGSNAD